LDTASKDNPASDAGRRYDSRSEEAVVRLLRVAGILQVRLARMLKHYNLSPAGYDILVVIDDAGGSLPAKAVSERIATASPDLTRLIQRLVAKGWVITKRDPADRRALLVELTGPGRSLIQKVAGPASSLHKQMLGRIKKSDRKDLVRILQTLEDEGSARI